MIWDASVWESYGGKSYSTPNLNRLATQGAQFNYCYSTPICTTSRVQIMTGKYNFRNYECFAYLPPHQQTFGHLLKKAGYKTMIAGKWQLNGHNAQPKKENWDDTSRPLQMGFDEYHLWQVHERKRERYWGADLVVNGKEQRMDDDIYSPDYFADQICQFIERNRNDRFFVYYPMLLAHAPFVRFPTSKSNSTRRDHFKDMVEYTDEVVGRIDRKLEKLNLTEDTLFIFTADNGTDRSMVSQLDNQEIRGGKALPITAGIHVPMICKWTGSVKAGSTINSMVDFTDFFVSFAELSNQDVADETLDGISFIPALRQRPGIRRNHSVCHYDCRWGRFPATQFAFDPQLKVYEDGRIYDTIKDPLEQHTLSESDLEDSLLKKTKALKSELGKLPKLNAESLVPGPRRDHPNEKPNIILMMADDLGWGDVGFNGNQVIETPNLDELASAGIKFERFYAQSAVCSPTRGSCLTGRHPFRYGIYGANVGHLKTEETTLAELLKEHGYSTGHFGKWHLGTLDRKFSGKGKNRHPEKNYLPPSAAGFEKWFSTEYAVATWNPYDPSNALSNKHAGDPRVLYWEDGENVTKALEGDDSRIIMDKAIPFIEQNSKSKTPFFAVIWFHAPHKPVIAGPSYRAKYSNFPVSAQHYYGCITAMDDQIGRLMECLKNNSVDENTMLCFCSDNGPEGKRVGDGTSWGTSGGLRGRKRSLYEGGIRVPAAVKWPARIRPGSTTNVPCVTSDYFPTVAEIIGCDIDSIRNCDGMSLVRVFDGLKRRPKSIGFMDRKKVVWMEGQYKLIKSENGEFELFDLNKDSKEEKNLAIGSPEKVQSMSKRMTVWKNSVLGDSTGNKN